MAKEWKQVASELREYIDEQNYFSFSISQEIDGRALTLLSLDEIHKCLEVTLGPAIKLHFTVQKLKKKPR